MNRFTMFTALITTCFRQSSCSMSYPGELREKEGLVQKNKDIAFNERMFRIRFRVICEKAQKHYEKNPTPHPTTHPTTHPTSSLHEKVCKQPSIIQPKPHHTSSNVVNKMIYEIQQSILEDELRELEPFINQNNPTNEMSSKKEFERFSKLTLDEKLKEMDI